MGKIVYQLGKSTPKGIQKLEELRKGVRALGSAGCLRQGIAFAVVCLK